MKAYIVLAAITAILVIASPFAAHGAPEQNCLAWEQATLGTPGRPVIDRLASSTPYGQLLNGWLADNCMRLNYVQVLGTHNSYHVEPRAEILQLIASFDQPAAWSLEYTHRPIDDQLDLLGIRQLELDVFTDPAGGLFAVPLGGLLPFPDPDLPVPVVGLLGDGLKVMHIPDVDFKTNCLTFVACLTAIKAWSDANPDHLPLLVLVEAKDEAVPPEVEEAAEALLGIELDFVDPVPFGPAQLSSIDAQILNVFTRDQLITPDDVRGDRATLEEAVLNDGWPALKESRGRVMFALDNDDEKRDLYIAGHASLAWRVMFTNSPPGSQEAAFVEVDEPRGNVPYIQELVSMGYLVRTRADADTLEARFGDTTRRDAALASGAQFISTDYPEPDPDLSTGYTGYLVEIPGDGAFRCNPVLSPPTCDPAALEAATD